MLAKNNSLTAS